MYKIEQKFRATYTGEDVATFLEFRDGQQQEPVKEWVPNSVFNNYITSQAVVIGGGETARKFPLNKLKDHRGGLLGSNKLQTYGCNDMFKNIVTDFHVAVGPDNVKELVAAGYHKKSVVYTNSKQLLKYPGKMYLVPQDPPFNAGTLAIYLAAFDGHTKIFMLGCETEDKERPFWVQSAGIVFNTYPDTEFVYITQESGGAFPEEWSAMSNVRHISVQQFILEADIG